MEQLKNVIGSTFNFTKQTTSIKNDEHIKIMNQNFDFDLEQGITNGELELSKPHYYMEIYKK